jgi:hypothetical protein
MRPYIQVMKPKAVMLLLLASLLLGGCASTIESRRKERTSAYASLDPEFRALVDQGRIKVGMPMDAVYIAWGKPSQIIQSESSGGQTVTWLYHGTYLQEYRYWSYSPWAYHGYYPYYYSSPMLDYDYIPHHYVRAEVTFEDGLVKQWRTLPQGRY